MIYIIYMIYGRVDLSERYGAEYICPIGSAVLRPKVQYGQYHTLLDQSDCRLHVSDKLCYHHILAFAMFSLTSFLINACLLYHSSCFFVCGFRQNMQFWTTLLCYILLVFE